MKLGKVVSQFTGTAAAPASSPAPRMQRLAGGLRLGGVLGQLGGGGHPMDVTVIDGPVAEPMFIPIEVETPTLVTMIVTWEAAAALTNAAGDDVLSGATLNASTELNNAAAAVVEASATIMIVEIPPGGSVTIYKQEVPE